MNLGNKGMGKQRAKLGKRSNNSKDNRSIIKASSSVSKAKICLSSTIQIHWNLREGNDNIFLALWLRSINHSLDSVDIYPNSKLNSALLKPPPEYAYTTQTLSFMDHSHVMVKGLAYL